MTYMLEDLDVLEVSAVPAPANQHASVVLFKNLWHKPGVKPETEGETEKGDGPVTVEELTKKLEALQAQVTDLTKQAADAEADKAAADAALDSLTKSAEDAGLDIEDGKIVKRADPEFVEIDGEKVEKALVPAPLLKALEKQAAEIAKMQAKAEEVELAKRGDAELPNLAGTALAKGRLLSLVEKDEDLMKSLRAADAAMAKSYQETGHSNTQDEASATYKLNALAKARAEATDEPFETAYAKVIKTSEGRELYKAHRAEAN